jgi:hypothetical protein
VSYRQGNSRFRGSRRQGTSTINVTVNCEKTVQVPGTLRDLGLLLGSRFVLLGVVTTVYSAVSANGVVTAESNSHVSEGDDP